MSMNTTAMATINISNPQLLQFIPLGMIHVLFENYHLSSSNVSNLLASAAYTTNKCHN